MICSLGKLEFVILLNSVVGIWRNRIWREVRYYSRVSEGVQVAG